MLTKSGTAMAATAVGLVLAGIWADYPEVVIFGLASAGTVLVSMAWLLARPRLAVGRQVHPRRVFEGNAARAVLTVKNIGRRRSPPLEIAETVGENRTTVRIPALASGQQSTVAYLLPTTERGRYLIPPFELGHSDPLRLACHRRASGAALVVHVYPRIHTLAPVVNGGPQDADGATASSAPPGGAAFHSLREYVPGDDWRLIHWGVTARTGTVMARHLVVPDEPRQLVLLDTSAASYTANLFEDAVRVAASFCVAAERARLPAQLRTTGEDARGASNEWGNDLSTALEFLSTVDSGSDRGLTSLPEVVRDVVSLGQGVALVVVTGRVDAERLELLTLLRPQFLSISLAQLVTPEPGQAIRPRGALAVAAPTSTQFAASWNRLVLR